MMRAKKAIYLSVIDSDYFFWTVSSHPYICHFIFGTVSQRVQINASKILICISVECFL